MMKQIHRLRPGAPSNLTLGAVDGSSQALSWTAPSHTGTGYNVYYRLAGATAWTLFENTALTSSTVTGLSAGTAYQYTVKTVNSYGESTPCNIVSQSTTGGGGGGPGTTFISDTFSDTFDTFNDAPPSQSDNGQTRTPVVGKIIGTGGVAKWANDGEGSSPAKFTYGDQSEVGVYSWVVDAGDGKEGRLYFNCNSDLTDGWCVLMGDAVYLCRIDDGDETVVASGGTFTSPATVLATVSGGNVSVVVNSGETSISSQSLSPYGSQTYCGIGSKNDDNAEHNSLTLVL